MAGVDTNQLRCGVVAETTNATTPTSPSFLTHHKAIHRNAGPTRTQQATLVAGGALLGDKLLTNMSSLTLSNAPVVYGLLDPIFETLFQGAWSTNVLKDAKAFKTVTIENSIPAGLGGTRTYWRDVGVRATNATLEMVADNSFVFSADFMGMASQASSTSALSGATYTDPTNNDEFTVAVDLGLVTIAGFTLNGMRSLKINFAFEGVEAQPIQGTTLAGITPGACRVSAEMRFYADADFKALFDAPRGAAAQTAAAFAVTLGSVTSKKYTLAIPKMILTVADLKLDEPTGFIDVVGVGTYSTSDACVMQLTRAVA